MVFGRSLFREKKGTYDQNPAERKQVMMPDIESVAKALAYAIEQPADVEIDEIVIRPTAQEF